MLNESIKDITRIIREKVSISEIIGNDVNLTRRGHKLLGLCPFHPEKTPSFSIDEEKAFYHCFGCGKHGDVINYRMERNHLSFIEVVKAFSQELGLSFIEKKDSDKKQSLYTILEEVSKRYQNHLRAEEGRKAREYLTMRGISPEIIDFFQIGYAPNKKNDLYHDLLKKNFSRELLLETGLFINPSDASVPYNRFYNRVMFPIKDTLGRTIAFGGRLLGEGHPKYLNSSDTLLFQKSLTLYNYHSAKNYLSKETPFVIVEGYFDVIALHKINIKTAIAPLGTSLTKEHLEMIWKRCDKPILCFDGDEAGKRAIRRSIEKSLDTINEFKTLNSCFLPKNEDPDGLIAKGEENLLKNLITAPISLGETAWKILTEEVTLESLSLPENEAIFQKTIEDLIVKINNKNLRFAYKRYFSLKLNFLIRNGRNKLLKREENLFYPRKNSSQIKILFAILIQHPHIIPEVFEELSQVDCPSQELKKIKELLINKGREELEKESYLEDFVNLFIKKELGGQKLWLKKDNDTKKVLTFWKEVWNQWFLKKQMEEEERLLLESAKTNFTLETWKKIKMLKESIINLKGEES